MPYHRPSAGELDTLISSHHSRLVMAPVFGAPPVAEAGKLLVVMAGDYRSKKEVAHILIPGVGRKVLDLGGNLEKGAHFFRPFDVMYLTKCVSS